MLIVIELHANEFTFAACARMRTCQIVNTVSRIVMKFIDTYRSFLLVDLAMPAVSALSCYFAPFLLELSPHASPIKSRIQVLEV